MHACLGMLLVACRAPYCQGTVNFSSTNSPEGAMGRMSPETAVTAAPSSHRSSWPSGESLVADGEPTSPAKVDKWLISRLRNFLARVLPAKRRGSARLPPHASPRSQPCSSFPRKPSRRSPANEGLSQKGSNIPHSSTRNSRSTGICMAVARLLVSEAMPMMASRCMC